MCMLMNPVVETLVDPHIFEYREHSLQLLNTETRQIYFEREYLPVPTTIPFIYWLSARFHKLF